MSVRVSIRTMTTGWQAERHEAINNVGRLGLFVSI